MSKNLAFLAGAARAQFFLCRLSAHAIPAILAANAEAQVADGSWQRVDLMPPVRREAAVAFDSHRRQLVVFGGYHVVGGVAAYLNDLWVRPLDGGPWKQLLPPGSGPGPRAGATSVYDEANQRLVLFGGFDGTSYLNQLWAFSLEGDPEWTQLVPEGSQPPSRAWHVAIYDPVRQRMVMFGGKSGAIYIRDTWELALSGVPSWSRPSLTGSPAGRARATAAYDSRRQELILFGGTNTSVGAILGDTWTLSLSATHVWTLVPLPAPDGPRKGAASTYDAEHDCFVMFGGRDHDGIYFGVSVLDLTRQAWQRVESTDPGPDLREDHFMVYDPLGKRSIAFGGRTLSGADESDYWALQLGAGRLWTPHDPPRVRYDSMVLDPVAGKLIRFGGAHNGDRWEVASITNEQMELDLKSSPPLWTSVALEGVRPSPRYGHRAVWDPLRDRMLVLDGYQGFSVGSYAVSELWEYRPRPYPVWTLLSPLGAPPGARGRGGLVFDIARDRLLVFGGSGGIGYSWGSFNDVWELPLSGPRAMTWKQLAPTGTRPGPQWGIWGFTMVMDPARDRAIIFGGGDYYNFSTNDVFALDLGVDPPNWTRIPSVGTAPGPRMLHAAAINTRHDRLVVYGGT